MRANQKNKRKSLLRRSKVRKFQKVFLKKNNQNPAQCIKISNLGRIIPVRETNATGDNKTKRNEAKARVQVILSNMTVNMSK